ncbi:hypothetical protein P3S68_016012 [Capsicum galapagoense]
MRSQAKLQRNLMYLAAIADSQSQPPSMHSQVTCLISWLLVGAFYRRLERSFNARV